jgi:uncharacterized protein YjbI with pentapeptide repeats
MVKPRSGAPHPRNLAAAEHLNVLREGATAWNSWRTANPRIRPILRNCNLESEVFPRADLYDLPEFSGFDFSRVDLHMIGARSSFFADCTFDGASINSSDLCFSHFSGCSFRKSSMRVSKLGSASFLDCNFDGADLSYCTAQDTDFSGSSFVGSTLNHARFVKTNFSRARFVGTSIYGIAAWDLCLDGCEQRDLRITEDDSGIEVDSVEVAQLVHLLLTNSRLRTVIDTLTAKVVLILGRFTPERRKTLERLRALFRESGVVPVLFDFDRPQSRNLTETVSTLAHLARLVIVDLTDPRSVPHELAMIVPFIPSVPIQPIIARGAEPYAMFEHHEQYPWVLPIQEYDASTLASLVTRTMVLAEERRKRPR